ncbi:MAG: alpha/beta hydrolase, partial [Myxococcaceae bacterium]
FQALATQTRDLLDTLGVDKVAVVGHSMGGMVATRFALMFPDRVEKLALVNPIGLEDWKRYAPYTSVDQVFQEELKKTPEGIRAYMQQFYFAGQWKPEYDELTDILSGWTRGPDHERISWVAALTQDMVFTQPVLYEFPDLRAPTLLIIGQRDRTAIGRAAAPPEVREQMGDYPKLGKAAAAAIPNSTLVELPGIGHIPQVEAWDAYRDALVTFLGQ